MVLIEVSFGPLADEVNVMSVVVEGDEPKASQTVLETLSQSDEQLRYIDDVLGGTREAAVRRHRRLPSSLAVKWDRKLTPRVSRLLDISVGGAFILSEDLPDIGDQVTVQLRTGDVTAPLRVQSTVSWIRGGRGDRRGFGVSFKLADMGTATRLKDVVREHESAFAGA